MRHDVIVVLGAGFEADGQPSTVLARRAQHAARLMREGCASYVIATGGADRWQRTTEADAMAKIMMRAGISATSIKREDKALNTDQNARFSGELMTAQGWQSALLVTDRAHMPRACLAFRHYGIAVTPAPVPDIPRRFLRLIREAMAYSVYAFRYLIRK